MTISERARSPLRDMPEHEKPLSEQFRLAGEAWADANAAAKLYEETKQTVFSRIVMRVRDGSIVAKQKELEGSDYRGKQEWAKASSVAHAEHIARASDEYAEHIQNMTEARAKADVLRVRMKYLEMRYGEWQSADANARRERQMGRHGT